MITPADLLITQHAIDRFRQRFDRRATVHDVERAVIAAKLAGKAQTKSILRQCPGQRYNPDPATRHYRILTARQIVFACRYLPDARIKVVTCWDMTQDEREFHSDAQGESCVLRARRTGGTSPPATSGTRRASDRFRPASFEDLQWQ